MPIVYKSVPSDGNVVVHWRTKGSKNGVRVWQNEDGSYTEAGRNFKPGGRYNQSDSGGGDRVTKAESKAAAKAEAKKAKNAEYNEKIAKSIPYSRDDLSDYEKQQELSVMNAQLKYAKDMEAFQKAAEMNNIGEMKAALKKELKADEAKIIIGVGVAALAVGGLYLAGGQLNDNALQTIIKFIDPTGATRLAGQIGTDPNAADAANAANAANAADAASDMNDVAAEPEFETPRIETPDTESKVEPEAPKAEPEAPKAEPEAPKAEPEAPKAEPEAPKAEPEAPKAEPEAPKAEPEAPKAETSTTKSDRPAFSTWANGFMKAHPDSEYSYSDEVTNKRQSTPNMTQQNNVDSTVTRQSTPNMTQQNNVNSTVTRQSTPNMTQQNNVDSTVTRQSTPNMTQQNNVNSTVTRQSTPNMTQQNGDATLDDLDAYTQMLMGKNQAAINAYNRGIAQNMSNSNKKKK